MNAQSLMTGHAQLNLLPASVQEVLESLVPTVSVEEIYTHLENMPADYWERTSKTDLIFHLATIHDFFRGLSRAGQAGILPVVRKRHFPKKGHTEIAICTWDRKGLVAKIAGAIACAEMNIKNAFVYTRYDHVVLDLFQVNDHKGRHITDKKYLLKMEGYLAQSLEALEPLDLGELLAHSASPKSIRLGKKTPPSVLKTEWINHHFTEYTSLRVTSSDTPRLLYHILDELTRQELNIHFSVIHTDTGGAHDEFCVTDKYGRKLIDAAQRKEITDALSKRIRSLLK